MHDDFRNIGRAERVNLRDEAERAGEGGVAPFLHGSHRVEDKTNIFTVHYEGGKTLEFTGTGIASEGLAHTSGDAMDGRED